MSLEYYDTHSQEFFNRTFNVDHSPLYEVFLQSIPQGGHILDAGCGSGRDSLAFINKGYTVTSMDASLEMCKLASAHTGQEVILKEFQQIEWKNKFDGIWAFASLLHVSRDEIQGTLGILKNALKPGGLMLISFKQGTGERVDKEGRFYNDYDEEVPGCFIENVSRIKGHENLDYRAFRF